MLNCTFYISRYYLAIYIISNFILTASIFFIFFYKFLKNFDKLIIND